MLCKMARCFPYENRPSLSRYLASTFPEGGASVRASSCIPDLQFIHFASNFTQLRSPGARHWLVRLKICRVCLRWSATRRDFGHAAIRKRSGPTPVRSGTREGERIRPPRCELTWTRTHGQAVQGGETHRAFDASTAVECTHGGPAAKVGNNHLLIRQIWSGVTEPVGDILVRQSMESLAAYAFSIELLGNRVVVGNLGMAAVECGVEASNLQQARPSVEQHSDRAEVVGLMQRRERR
jgi:hypothetical protein